MPGRDGTGPMGWGRMTGGGLGICSAASGAGFGLGQRQRFGLGCRRGIGDSYISNSIAAKTPKELLEEQKKLLQSRMDMISQQLENLSEDNE